MLMTGNYKYADTEAGEWDAGNGTLLLQNDDGTFRYIPNTVHGFWAQQEARELCSIMLADGRRAIVTGNNQEPLQMQIYTNSK
jgi:hypothetical protein